MENQQSTIIGIDLGTTNSVVAVYRDGKVHVIEEDGSSILPSVVGMTLDGKLRVRLPTPEEAKAAIDKGTRAGGAPLFSGDAVDAENIGTKLEDSDFTLRKAAEATKKAKDQNSAEWNGSLYDRLGLSLEMRRLQEQASERASRTLMYEGAFQITMQADVFDRAPKLASQFPVDPKLGRVPLMVPIEGNLYEITLKQAEDIYQQGRRQ